MNVKIYEFESHRKKEDSKYYKETMYRDNYHFYILFEGNKGSKYGFEKNYKMRIGRKGRFNLTVEDAKEWIQEKQAEAREFERASFKMFKEDLKKLNQEKKDKETGKAWLYYINSAI